MTAVTLWRQMRYALGVRTLMIKQNRSLLRLLTVLLADTSPIQTKETLIAGALWKSIRLADKFTRLGVLDVATLLFTGTLYGRFILSTRNVL